MKENGIKKKKKQSRCDDVGGMLALLHCDSQRERVVILPDTKGHRALPQPRHP